MAHELARGGVVRRDRSGVILVLGILSLAVPALALPCGISAWVMASRDMKAMRAGAVDPSGRQLTRAGVILGIVGTSLGILFVLTILTILVVGWSMSESRG